MKKILMTVGWEVQNVKKDDKSKHISNLLLPDQKYGFFRYWPANNLKFEVIGYKKIPLFSIIEKKFLHFHLFQSLRILHKMRKYDLLIFFHSQMGIVPALFKSIFKLKTPLILIDVEGLGRKNSRYVLPFLKKAISSIDHLFYFASVQKEDYQRYLPEIIPRSDFIPLGLDPSRFSTNGAKVEDYILSIGYQGTNFRDWRTLIKAYAQLNTKTRLLIVGRNKLEPEEIGGEKLPSGIEFLKKTNLLTLNEITSRAKFVVLSLPERRHSFAQLTLLGCMALGKGLVISRVSSVTDYLKDKEDALLVEPDNSKDLADKMKLLLNNPDLVVKLGQIAKKKVESKYTENRMAQAIYQRLKDKNLI
ncbi:MAG: glycosyltransferase family 4 protein [candidate division Zixibacteria bacterium]|nr:glycosyltransferase family 4 protein [candidate division Zixibacteria bacterium]